LEGTIYLNIVQPFNSRGVFLRIEGYEDMEWEETKTVHKDGPNEHGFKDEVVKHKDKRHFLHYRIPVYAVQQQMMPGQYQFPFSFQLPTHLPGSFYERPQQGRYDEKWHASIYYRIEAECDSQGWNWNIKHEQPLTIHERVWGQSEPQVAEKESNVMYCCCFNQGKVLIRAHFSRDAYAPGEQATLEVEVENKSKSDVNYLHGRLKRRVTLGNGYDKHIEQELLQDIRSEGIPAGETLLGGQRRNIAIPITSKNYGLPQPSCHGEIVKCDYWLEVDCAISMAPDIVLEIPMTVFAPVTQWVAPTAPPAWNPSYVMNTANLQLSQAYAC